MSSSKSSEFYRKLIQSVKNQRNNDKKQETKKADTIKTNSAEDLLTRRAIEEILNRDTKIAGIKAKEFGAASRCPSIKPNTNFLNRTLNSCISHNNRKIMKTKQNCKTELKKLLDREKLRNSDKKFGERKHEYRKPEEKKSKEDTH